MGRSRQAGGTTICGLSYRAAATCQWRLRHHRQPVKNIDRRYRRRQARQEVTAAALACSTPCERRFGFARAHELSWSGRITSDARAAHAREMATDRGQVSRLGCGAIRRAAL